MDVPTHIYAQKKGSYKQMVISKNAAVAKSQKQPSNIQKTRSARNLQETRVLPFSIHQRQHSSRAADFKTIFSGFAETAAGKFNEVTKYGMQMPVARGSVKN